MNLLEKIPIIGDVYVEFYEKGIFTDVQMCRVSFNTIFIQK